MANLTCPACSTPVPEEAIVCPSCGSDLRTLVAPTARRGPARREPRERQGTPGSYMLIGVVLLVLGGVAGGAIGFDEPVGWLVAAGLGLFGQINLLIGVIARGVQVAQH